MHARSITRRRVLASALAAVLALAVSCGGDDPGDGDDDTGIANPASVYCEEQGGTIDIRTADDGAQTGFCVFDDGSECEEWSYYRGECLPDS